MYRYVKRILDLIMAIVLMIIFLIPMIIIGILIKLDSKGPVFLNKNALVKTEKYFYCINLEVWQ